MNPNSDHMNRKLAEALDLGDRTSTLLSYIRLLKLRPDAGDYGAILVYTFFERHLELAKSIHLLCNQGLHAGAALIARSILEGLMSLLWAVGQEDTRQARAKRWAAYVWHEESLHIKGQREYGYAVDPEWEAVVKDWLKQFSDIPKLQQRSWKATEDGSEVTVRQIFETYKDPRDIKGSHLHPLYQKLSAYQHWSPIASNVEYKEDRYVKGDSEKHIESTLTLSLVCFIQVMEFTAVYFNLENEGEIKLFREKVLDTMTRDKRD